MKKNNLFKFLFVILIFLSSCNNNQNNIFKHEHRWNSGKVIKEVTCVEDGTILYKCKLCRETKEESILAKGHVEVIDEAVPPSCETSGLTEGSHCAVCNEVIIPQEFVEKLGKHQYDENNVCIRCGEYYYTEGLSFQLNDDVYYVTKYMGKSKDVFIPSYYKGKPVFGIEEYAFRNDIVAERIVIAEGVKVIKKQAFKECCCLKELVLPNSIEVIEEYAFQGCAFITSFIFPSSLTTINRGILANCIGLKNLIIPDNITDIKDNAFDGCLFLTSIVIPDTVINIGQTPFNKCVRLSAYCLGKDENGGWSEYWDVYSKHNIISGKKDDDYIPVYWYGEWKFNSLGIPEPLN